MRKLILNSASWLAGHLPQPLLQRIYRIPALARLLRRTLNRAAPQGMSRVQIAGGLNTGCSMELDLQTEKDLWLGTYEPDLQAALADLAVPGSIIYDVGANIGYMTLMLANCTGPEGYVFAFEPLPENQERLSRTIELNGLNDRIAVVKKAAGRTTGRTQFWVHASTSMGRIGPAKDNAGDTHGDNSYQRSIEVELVSLDDFIYRENNPAPDVVKLDIEGGEVEAMPGMRNMLREHRPLMFVEIHGTEAGQVVWHELVEAGYGLYWMREGYPSVEDAGALQGKAYIIAWHREAG